MNYSLEDLYEPPGMPKAEFATRVDRISDGNLTVGSPPRIRSAGPGNESGEHIAPVLESTIARS